MKRFLAAAMAATMGLGMATAAVAPAASQIVLFGTETNSRNDQRAEQIERQGDRRAARAADNGNYRKAAKIQAQSERRADRVAGRDDNNGFGIVIPIQ